MSEDRFQRIFDKWPDQDPLLPYDDFLVGGSSDQYCPGYGVQSLASQLMGVQDCNDLKKSSVESKADFEIRDDRDDFIREKVKLKDSAACSDLFFQVKLQVFREFDWTKIQSTQLKGIPLREADLVLTEDDHYLLEYLSGSLSDYFAIAHIALLQAYRNMGITVARFWAKDECALCCAHDGMFYDVDYLIGLFSSGDALTHRYCECAWTPVIQREYYNGPLVGHLEVSEARRGDIILQDVPVELVEDIWSAIGLHSRVDAESFKGEDFPCKTLKFVNMRDYALNDSDLTNSSGVVLIQEKDRLVVHNSYVGCNGPVEYIQEFMKKLSSTKVELDEVADEERFLVNGRFAVKRKGKFWDIETGECLV